jgi:hypothetical protein
LSPEEYWKLKFLIHIHDTFKAEAEPDAAIIHPRSHASLARAFALEFTQDSDLLNMIQFHDEGYALWQQFTNRGAYDAGRLRRLIEIIQDLDLFLAFLIIDSCTAGKSSRAHRSIRAFALKELNANDTNVQIARIYWGLCSMEPGPCSIPHRLKSDV